MLQGRELNPKIINFLVSKTFFVIYFSIVFIWAYLEEHNIIDFIKN